jgi:hypothetical protein
LENPNSHDYKILVQVKHVHMLDQLKLHHKLVHLIYNHANVIESYQDYEHNHVKMDNVEKLVNLKTFLIKKSNWNFFYLLCWANSFILHTCKSL